MEFPNPKTKRIPKSENSLGFGFINYKKNNHNKDEKQRRKKKEMREERGDAERAAVSPSGGEHQGRTCQF